MSILKIAENQNIAASIRGKFRSKFRIISFTQEKILQTQKELTTVCASVSDPPSSATIFLEQWRWMEYTFNNCIEQCYQFTMALSTDLSDQPTSTLAATESMGEMKQIHVGDAIKAEESWYTEYGPQRGNKESKKTFSRTQLAPRQPRAERLLMCGVQPL